MGWHKVLVTELTRWGPSISDLLSTFELFQSRNVFLMAQTGMEFDLSTSFGTLATFMIRLAKIERDLCRFPHQVFPHQVGDGSA